MCVCMCVCVGGKAIGLVSKVIWTVESPRTTDFWIFLFGRVSVCSHRPLSSLVVTVQVLVISDENQRIATDEIVGLLAVNRDRLTLGSSNYKMQFANAVYPGGYSAYKNKEHLEKNGCAQCMMYVGPHPCDVVGCLLPRTARFMCVLPEQYTMLIPSRSGGQCTFSPYLGSCFLRWCLQRTFVVVTLRSSLRYYLSRFVNCYVSTFMGLRGSGLSFHALLWMLL